MTKNRFKVVMLPTEKANSTMTIEKCIKQLLDMKIGDIAYTPRMMHSKEYFQAQQLLVVDTEATIEVGDWYYTELRTKEYGIHKCDSKRIMSILGNYKGKYGKIIASTDSSLDLPTLPKQFIQEYVEQPFDDVPEKYICRKCGSLAIDSKALMNYHYIDKSYRKGEIEFETKLEDCLKCSSCGNSWVNGKESTREQALKWWNSSLLYNERQIFTDKYVGTNRHFTTLIGREIEMIWKREVASKIPEELNQQPLTPYECVKVTPELVAILRNCYKKGIDFVTFPAGSWDEEDLITICDVLDEYQVIFHRGKIDPYYLKPEVKTTDKPIWKNWYMTITY